MVRRLLRETDPQQTTHVTNKVGITRCGIDFASATWWWDDDSKVTCARCISALHSCGE